MIMHPPPSVETQKPQAPESHMYLCNTSIKNGVSYLAEKTNEEWVCPDFKSQTGRNPKIGQTMIN